MYKNLISSREFWKQVYMHTTDDSSDHQPCQRLPFPLHNTDSPSLRKHHHIPWSAKKKKNIFGSFLKLLIQFN